MHKITVEGKPVTYWSRDHAACVSCGTTTEEHYAKGLCFRCYRREQARKKAARRKEARHG